MVSPPQPLFRLLTATHSSNTLGWRHLARANPGLARDFLRSLLNTVARAIDVKRLRRASEPRIGDRGKWVEGQQDEIGIIRYSI